MVSPWHTLLDDAKFNSYVDDVVSLGITTVAAGHSARAQR